MPIRKPAKANYEIDEDLSTDEWLVIRDLGPWDEHPTVTNDMEHVIDDLLRTGQFQFGQRLFAYDSEGILDEVVIDQQRSFYWKHVGVPPWDDEACS